MMGGGGGGGGGGDDGMGGWVGRRIVAAEGLHSVSICHGKGILEERRRRRRRRRVVGRWSSLAIFY